MKMKTVNSAVLMILMAVSSATLAAGGGKSESGKGGENGGEKIDDNPSESDLYVSLYGVEKQNSADAPDITESELETLKVTPPPVQSPVSNVTGQQLVNAWLAPDSGVVAQNISYLGQNNQARTYAANEFSTVTNTAGIVLTTGMANFANSNTSSGATGITGTGASYEVSKLSNQYTYDANSLRFDFTLDNSTTGANGITTKFVFASEEYPEWTGIFRDGFALVVDGINYARFDASNFAVLDNCSSNGVYPCTDTTQNDNGFFTPNANATAVAFEFDGYTAVLTVNALLNPALTQHSLEAVIADSNDPLWDSAVFLSGLSAATLPGTFQAGTPTPVPTPAPLVLFASGLAFLGRLRRKR
ncbi:MAG: hypothetical protein BVN35_00150 [Proteobacteria bacterium ST_bin11]|nr:MAG: hypothetical protein BVN35_00150 [Proteobacteria bacterium ST_bin11]